MGNPISYQFPISRKMTIRLELNDLIQDHS